MGDIKIAAVIYNSLSNRISIVGKVPYRNKFFHQTNTNKIYIYRKIPKQFFNQIYIYLGEL